MNNEKELGLGAPVMFWCYTSWQASKKCWEWQASGITVEERVQFTDMQTESDVVLFVCSTIGIFDHWICQIMGIYGKTG